MTAALGRMAFILVAGACAAFPPAAARAQAVQSAQAEGPPVWTISGPKGSARLFGAFHLLPPDFKWRTPALERALEEAQVIVFETTPASADKDQATRALIDRYGMLPEGKSLRAILPEQANAQFEKIAADLQIAPAGMDRMRPWLAAAVLGVQFMSVRGYDPNRGVEAQLADWARAKGRRLAELESNEAQMRTFAALTPRLEADLFAASLRQIREMPGRLDDVLVAYSKGDLAGLDRQLNAGFEGLPALRRRVLKDRHDRWLARIEKLLADRRPHLIVVGAAHLAGADGLVALLRARGYRVAPP